MSRPLLFKFVALSLASVFISFQLEVFDEEYEANHPKPPDTCAFSQPSVNWETFDKNNAPKAFTFDSCVQIEWLEMVEPERDIEPKPFSPFNIVRDKSPPLSFIIPVS